MSIYRNNMIAWLRGRAARQPDRYRRVQNIATGVWTNLISGLDNDDNVLITFVEVAGDDRVATAFVRFGNLGAAATIVNLSTTSGHRFDISRDAATGTIRCARGTGLNASNYVIAQVM